MPSRFVASLRTARRNTCFANETSPDKTRPDHHRSPVADNEPSAQRHGPAAAAEQAKLLIPHPELEAALFASEPMLLNPANMDIDAEGRVWVTEGVNYRLFKPWGKIQPEGDRIRILEDTDGDGRADTAKTFYQGNDVNAALGIAVLGTKVIVSCSPKILLFTDENATTRQTAHRRCCSAALAAWITTTVRTRLCSGRTANCISILVTADGS